MSLRTTRPRGPPPPRSVARLQGVRHRLSRRRRLPPNGRRAVALLLTVFLGLMQIEELMCAGGELGSARPSTVHPRGVCANACWRGIVEGAGIRPNIFKIGKDRKLGKIG
jgi:hypothetical protein